jgi:Mn2+/Fe2+ NRAMP family transporter
MLTSVSRRGVSSALLGSAFLMATSAIGPGFITQTTVFTEKLKASFGFIILCSIIIDIIVQLNIWRVVSVSGMRSQDLANRTFSGSGYVLTTLVVIGGLAFNIGNIAGAGLGVQVLIGWELHYCVIISTVIALIIFWMKEIGKALDVFSKALGIVMIGMMIYIVFKSKAPIGAAIYHTILPEHIDTTAIIILVGGTVGGYISFAGVHRLIDAGISGQSNVKEVTRASVKGILIASTMRILLFLAALGVVSQGASLDPGNPAASVFRIAADEIGYKVFGLILWAAAITSVVGSAYTSISFLKTFHPSLHRREKFLITIFILISAVTFLIVGRPVNILVIVGALNAFILPIALAIVLRASTKIQLMKGYTHPLWLQITGWVGVGVLAVMSVKTLIVDLPKLW